MRIITPTEIERVAWAGTLEPVGVTFKGEHPRPRVTLGKPAWWSAEQALQSETGKKWTPPAGHRSYTLLRLACTLHPLSQSRAHYTEATLTAYLRPHSEVGVVVAHDLYPQRLTADSTRTFTIGLGPDLKFAESFEATLGEVGAEIEYHIAFPVIQGYGLGESRPYWQFAHHAAHPLLGCQSVYVVLDAPRDARGVRLSLELTATVETRWGPIRVGTPAEAQAGLSRIVAI